MREMENDIFVRELFIFISVLRHVHPSVLGDDVAVTIHDVEVFKSVHDFIEVLLLRVRR